MTTRAALIEARPGSHVPDVGLLLFLPIGGQRARIALIVVLALGGFLPVTMLSPRS